MAPKKAVPSLHDLSLGVVSSSVLSTILDPSPFNEFNGTERLETLNILLNCHIYRSHPRFLSQLCIKGLKSMYSETLGKKPEEFFKNREKIANLLFSAFSSVQPLIINVDEWCDLILHKLIQQSDKILNAKIFYSTKTMATEVSREFLMRKIFLRCSLWSHLQSFTMLHCCTDQIVNIISLNCPLLRVLDVKFSSRVTDKCIKCLKKCFFLQKVHLSETKLSSMGLAEFLTESVSSNLRDFECFFKGMYILKNALIHMDQIAQYSSNTSLSGDSTTVFSSNQIQRFRCFNLDSQSLILLSKYFPSISELFLEYQAAVLDYRCLQQIMGSLQKLSLISPQISNQAFKNAVLFCGSLITELDVGTGVQSYLNEMMSTVPLLCPNIELLNFRQLAFFEANSFFPPRTQPPSRAFTKLKSLTWTNCSQISYAEFILMHAYKIENINIEAEQAAEYSYNEFILNVLETNPMAQLLTLRITHSETIAISVGMLQLIISNLERISSITCKLSLDDQKIMENYIKENNYDVKLV